MFLFAASLFLAPFFILNSYTLVNKGTIFDHAKDVKEGMKKSQVQEMLGDQPIIRDNTHHYFSYKKDLHTNKLHKIKVLKIRYGQDNKVKSVDAPVYSMGHKRK